MNNQYKTSVRDMKILTIIVLSVIEKIIDPLETRMTNVDPSIVRQYVRPLKNNYVKGCKTFKNCILGPKKDLLGQKKKGQIGPHRKLNF